MTMQLPGTFGMSASIQPQGFRFWEWLEQVKAQYRNNTLERGSTGRRDGGHFIESEFGKFSADICLDEDDDEYLLVGFVLPDDVYVQGEDGYIRMEGLRIYLEPA